MADVITRLKVESSEYDSKIKRATQSLNEMTTAAEREGSKIATANQKNIALAQSLGKMATVSTTARGKMSELSAAIESATIQYNRLTQAEKQGQFGKALNTSITQLQGRLNTIRTEMAAVQGQMGKVGAIGGGMGIGAQFGSGLKSAAMMFGPAALAIGGVTAAIGGMKKVVGDMVSLNMQFEQSTANLASIMGKSTEEISALTEQAKQLGATTRYTANEITELQTNLARLGFTQQEILNSTSAVQALATATGADLGEAANLAGAALRGFGLNATEMERVASVLSVSTTKSALSFEKLATAVPIVAPVAKQFGFTIEDTVTLLAKLSDAGMDASTAATATRNIFLKMADGSGKLSQAMGRPVHSVEEFGEALAEMREKGMSLNDILKMVGVRSTAAFAVFADNADKLNDFKQSITGCSEAMHDMERKQLNTLQGSVTILNSAWEGLMLTFSESNGTIKSLVDSLTELLGAYTKWRKVQQGGDAAISAYQEGVSNKEKVHSRQLVQRYRDAGWSDEDIYAKFSGQKKSLEDTRDAARELYDRYDKIVKMPFQKQTEELEKWKADFKEMFGRDTLGKWKDNRDYILQQIAGYNDQIAGKDYTLSLVNPTPTETGTETEDELTKASKERIVMEEKDHIAHLDRMKLGEEKYEEEVYKIKKAALEQILQLYAEDTKEYAQTKAKISDLEIKHQASQVSLAKKESPQEKAEKTVTKALEDYATTLNIASMRKEAGLDDDEKYKSKELAAHERLFDAYTAAYNLFADPKYKEAFEKEAAEILELAKTVKELKDAAQKKKEELSQQKQLDTRILGGLTGAAKKAGWNAEQLGVTGIKTKINAGIDITEDEWKKIQDTLNQRLQSLGLEPIQINFETGNVEQVFDEIKTQMDALKESMSQLSSGVGAISTIGNAFNDLKGIGEDLASAFSGEMDAWDALMTVFNSGISIMQTVIGVMEAINTLTELSSDLKKANTVATETEAATAMTSAATEAGAEATKAGANMTTAGTAAAASSAEAGEAVAGIPIVGPILAVAAIAAVLAATFAAMSKAKSAGKGFASGGIIPGNSFSGDNLRTSDYGINSGELILNRSQQNTIASQLQSNPMGNMKLSGKLSGKDILIAIDNTNRSEGGSRGYYTKIH